MSKNSRFSGAPSSNAGDAFHEAWALREALKLLDPRSPLTSLTLEGVRDSLDSDNQGAWHGVDCALYYDDATVSEQSQIELIQLKYSIAHSGARWTITRFCKSTNQRNPNSLARRLSKAFMAACRNKSDQLVRNTVSVRFVTNQPIADNLISAIQKCSRDELTGGDYSALKRATNLSKNKLRLFCERLELKGGEAARADLMAEVVNEIADLTQSATESIVDSLLMKVRERMMPQGLRPIDRAIVLSWFRIGDHTGLFPCEPKLPEVGKIVDRGITHVLSKAVRDHRRVCFHGGGGCGKTTVAQTLEPTLPRGSRVVLYDCFGGGTYRDRSQARHRPFEAFKQLANELARATNAPLFFPYDNAPDMPRSFRAKLQTAAGLLQLSNPSGLLVLFVDAADNAIHAATRVSPPDRCFVSDLLTFEELPENVRIVISTRTSRLPDLTNSHSQPHHVSCQPFSLEETANYLEINGLTGSADLLDDFHKLTDGNPRVQANAIKTAKSLQDAVEVLMPHGQSLDGIFENILHSACTSSGVDIRLTALSAALSVLPTPSPINYLAELCQIPIQTFKELIDDLLPNIRVIETNVEIANEDFEDYCRIGGEDSIKSITYRAADLLMRDRLESEYAAIHLFDLLVTAGRKDDLRTCLLEVDSTKVIRDPTRRHQVDLSRLRAALHVASLLGDGIDIAKTIITGAESLRTVNKAKALMCSNPDLSAAFISDTIRPLVLNDPKHRNLQGPLLMHLGAESARENDIFSARESLRAAYEWLNALFQSSKPLAGWSFDKGDLTAIASARFKLSGWGAVSGFCDQWTPRLVRFSIQSNLFEAICLEQGFSAVEDLLDSVDDEYLFSAVNTLVRARRRLGRDVYRRGLCALEGLDFERILADDPGEVPRSDQDRFLGEILFFLESSYIFGDSTAQVLSVLDRAWPFYNLGLDEAILARPANIDLFLRAVAVRARCLNESVDLMSLFASQKASVQGRGESVSLGGGASEEARFSEIKVLFPVYERIYQAIYSANQQETRAIASEFRSLFERVRHSHRYNPIREVIGQRIVEICARHGFGIDVCLAGLGELSSDPDFSTSTHTHWYEDLLLSPDAVESIVGLVGITGERIRNGDMLATEKADCFVSFSRLLLRVHRADSREYFSEALKMVEDADIETLDVLHALCRMFSRCRDNSQGSDERSICFSRLIHRAGSLLENESGFPQEEAFKALCAVSLPVAALTLSRWVDDGFGSVESELRTFVRCALQENALKPAEAILLAEVVSDDGLWLEREILAAASQSSLAEREAIAAHFAKRRLESVAPGISGQDLAEFGEFTSSLSESRPLPLQVLLDVEIFRKDHEALRYRSGEPSSTPTELVRYADGDPPKWSCIDPLDPEAIRVGLMNNRKARYYDQSTYLAALRARVRSPNQVSHIEALANLARSERFPDDAIKSILAAVSDWSGPAVRAWNRQNLANLIQDLGDSTLTHYWEGHASLGRLLEFLDSNDTEIRRLIVRTIEQHAYNLASDSLLQFASEFLLHLPSEEAESVIDWMLERVESRFRFGESSLDRYDLNVANLPATGTQITEALLYRFLGDIDAHVRWRAAHALRRAHTLGATEILDGVLFRASYPSDQEFTFRDIPFHRLNADLFLTVSLARLSFEAPEIVAKLVPKLLRVWTERQPHLLVGQFVARALRRTRDSGYDIGVDEAKLRRMACEDAEYAVTKEGDWSHHPKEQNGSRFHFSSIDTLPYWYSSAERLFADLPEGLFLKTAESWIVDKWGGDERTSEWAREPRRHRLERCNFNLYSNIQGSLPRIDRYSTYLEWHAMFAAVGQLVQAHPLRDSGANDPGAEFRQWVSFEDTTYSGAWLADIRQHPPRELRYWRLPEPAKDSWLNDTASFDGAPECVTEDGRLILASFREATISRLETEPGQETIRSRAAFVPPKTARALLRAFHATDNPSHVWVGDRHMHTGHSDIDAEFRMTPSVRDPMASRSLGLDQHDARRLNFRGLNLAPSHELLAAAELADGEPWEPYWKSSGGERATIRYECWSSKPNDSHVESSICSHPTVEGYRLSIEKGVLRTAMDTLGKDLILTVNWRRSQRERHGNYTQRGTDDGEHAEVLLFRRDGQIEDARGHIGTWY